MFNELSFKEYLDLVVPKYGNIKLYNLLTTQGYWIYQDDINSLDFDVVKKHISGQMQLTPWEEEFVEENGYDELVKINPELYNDNIGLSISTCSYYKRKASTNKIATINSFAIDVDYRKEKIIENFSPLRIFNETYLDLLDHNLVPTVVEYGHCYRMIYVLDNPIRLTNNVKKNKRFINLFKKLINSICEYFKKEFDLYAEPQQINSYYRIPGGRNEKDLSLIKVIKTGEKFNFNYLVDEFLEECPEDYRYPNKKTKKQNRFIDSMQKRLDDLTKINSDIHIGYRIKYLHLVYQTALAVYGNKDKAFDYAKKMNGNLNYGILSHKLKGAIFTSKLYKYKNTTIKKMLDLSEEYCNNKNIFMKATNKDEYNKEYYKKKRLKQVINGKTKKQQIEKIILDLMQVIDSDNFNKADFCAKNKISLRTFYRYKNKISEIKSKMNETIFNKTGYNYDKKPDNLNKKQKEEVVKLLKKIRMNKSKIFNDNTTICYHIELSKKEINKFKNLGIYIKKLIIKESNKDEIYRVKDIIICELYHS